MRKILILILSLFVMPAFGAQYRAAMVADMDSGRVLYSENERVENYPASLTKIMTMYLTFDALEHGRLHLDDYLIVSQSAAAASPVKLGLAAGSKIRVEDAIKAVTVLSANDVARVLAENLRGGQEESFATLMTRVANEIGLTGTHFENSSGLPNDDHLSTARDITLLSMAVYKHFPQYWKYFGIKTWTYNGKTYTNGNRLLGVYPGCDGMKTGFTNKSKYSLVATAKQNGHHLIAVVLGAENKDVRANVATKLLNNGFAKLGVAPAPVAAQPVQSSQPVQPVATQPVQPVSPQAQSATLSAAYNSARGMGATSSGNAGVQFGAFSSQGAAQSQVENLKSKLGITAYVEGAPNGLYRVRVAGLSESAAQNLKASASAQGIDCYVFH